MGDSKDTTEAPGKSEPIGDVLAAWARGLAGALIGGAIGFFLFKWIAKQGFYAGMLPGAGIGMGCGWLSGRASIAIGAACAVFAVAFTVATEWHVFPFIKDESFSYFLRHVHQLPPIKLIMMGFGVAFAFWFGRGRDRFVRRA